MVLLLFNKGGVPRLVHNLNGNIGDFGSNIGRTGSRVGGTGSRVSRPTGAASGSGGWP